MTPLLWRVVSVWLSVAVLFWCLSCYVGGTDSPQGAQRTPAPQRVEPPEESREKAEESWAFPALQASDNHPFIVEDQQKEEQATQEEEEQQEEEEEEEDKQPSLKLLEVEESAGHVQLETGGGPLQPEPEPERVVEDHPPAAQTQDPDQQASAAAPQDDLGSFDPQPDAPPSLSEEESGASGADGDGADRPPADCEGGNPYDHDSSPPIVLENTSNVHAAGTQTQPNPPPSSPAAPSSQHRDANTSHNDLSSPVASDSDPPAGCKDPEDIPTFDEWKRKVMEVEKEKTQSVHTANSGSLHLGKKVQKNFNNYASVECGAKILGSNPEAKSTSAILMENMDMYMLNPCSNKIWFVIELCEPVQVKQLDIANFELFSSTPRDFIVSISDRYPTNKWQKLGTFHARDERTVQSFPLDEHLYAKYVKMFAKYIKVELLSHFGSEHFCPLSLIRVFGTSMVEEYEEIADPPERPDDLDDDFGYTPEVKLSKNLIGSAKEAILNMVTNIAVNVLGGAAEMPGNVSSHDVNATEPPPEESATQNPPGGLSAGPGSDVEPIVPDPSVPSPTAPSSETPVPEVPSTHTRDLEVPHVEERPALPPGKDEEEPISSTITLLEKEEESDEEKEKEKGEGGYGEHQQGTPSRCSALDSFSSLCSCNASLQEYLHQQCSASLSKKRKCQTVHQNPPVPSIETPAWQPSLFPSGWREPQQPPSEVHQPRETEQAAEPEPESRASSSEAPQPPENTAASYKDSILELPLLEPSQSSNLPKHGVTDSSSAKPTPGVETPLLSSGEPEKRQDVLAEERPIGPSASPRGPSHVQPTVSVPVVQSPAVSAEETFNTVVPQPDANPPDRTDQTLSPTSPFYPDLPVFQEAGSVSAEGPSPVPDLSTEPEPSSGLPDIPDAQTEDISDDASAATAPPAAPALPSSPSLSDIYADPPNGTEQNGNQVHGSSQKESVFMRLNNRIKALEMNMSLSGRYLEQLSQRYRKQMEEMQKAFNKTVITLQNTSRIAEEQDQRQTESIQLLQAQLENMTRLVLNLSDRVSRLQVEVSERQNYLVLSLVLCFCLGLLLCANHCRIAAVLPNTEPEPPVAKSYSYCCPERQFSSCDEPGLKRSASYPLIHSESFQLATTEGPELLHTEDTQSLCTANRKKRRRKIKPIEKVETLRPSFHATPKLCNGGALCNGVAVSSMPAPLTKRLLPPAFRDSPSEGSSEGSSHSDDPSFCGIATSCSRICDLVPPPKSRSEKRVSRRRRPKPGCAVIDLLQAPKKDKSKLLQISTIEDIMKRSAEPSSGAFGVNVALSGPV